MVRSSFLVVFLYVISLQLWLKGDFSKSLEELIFWNIPTGVFDKVVDCRNFTSCFTSAFTMWRCHSNLKHSQETFVMESIFRIVIVIGDTGQLEKELYQRRFSGNLLKFSKEQFFRTYPEKCTNWFFYKR